MPDSTLWRTKDALATHRHARKMWHVPFSPLPNYEVSNPALNYKRLQIQLWVDFSLSA